DVNNIIQKYIPDVKIETEIPETVKPGDNCIPETTNIFIATPGMLALKAAELIDFELRKSADIFLLNKQYSGPVESVCDFMESQIKLAVEAQLDPDIWFDLSTPTKRFKPIYNDSTMFFSTDPN